ncbi:MAG: hypothetical protein WCG66_11945 [bacterium]
MKTTLDLPDPLFRQAKARAALRGISLRLFVTEAVQEKIEAAQNSGMKQGEPAWMRGFGTLSDLKAENRLVESRIAEAFESLGEEDRA